MLFIIAELPKKFIYLIYISKSLVSIGDSAFRDSYDIKEVYIDDLTAWRNISGLENLTSYIAYDYRLYLNGNLID